MKKYRLKRNPLEDYLLPWVVQQWYFHSRCQKRFGRWCVIAKFYRRGDARFFVRELRVDQRPTHSELIPDCMKKISSTELCSCRVCAKARPAHYGKPNW